MKVFQALDRFFQALQGERSPRTIDWYRDKLKPLYRDLGEREVSEISIDDLRALRTRLLQRTERFADHPTIPTRPGGLSPATVNDHIRATRRFFNWLVEEGILDHSPAARLGYVREDDREPKAIAPDDIVKILKAAQESSTRDYALVRFLASTGCRLGGLVTLTLDRLDIENRRAIVIEKFRGGNRARVVYFDEETARALRAWLEDRGEAQDDHVFLSLEGRPLTGSGVYQLLQRLAERGGVKGRFNPHSFRHAFARRLLKQGASLNLVGQLMGHRDVNTTSRYYARWADGELKQFYDRFALVENDADS